MSIKKIFGHQMVPPPSTTRATHKNEAEKSAGPRQGDKVDFSSVLQGVNKAREASSPADAQRAEKVASIKAQVAGGTYNPDMHKVAASLLKFVSQGARND
ncbi:MAG: flagellar biosynthesis anti-sigma factor FlgM [Geoalkalibacter sp.]|jgi:negative regulator of flagellin synthesis FlgM|uniref:flagellar biosynthesis anti-sigma factor FlgM n=1 Tax=Geoalkalibacter sp. TaxID=3041440 RepID=UPI002A960626|nr:flagellar biosynthesis anti-sigma factor FlgM [Thermodesulfobacteriota bacterium]